MMQSNPLVGAWRIVSFQVEIDGAKERRDVYDEQPSGFLIITDEGRMMALITAGDRASDAPSEALFACMTAYSGRYRLTSDSLVTKVDSAWHPAWIGTEVHKSGRAYFVAYLAAAGGSAGEMNLGVTSVAAPKAASSRTARYS
jgi:Lipocalin-like domain